MFGPSAIMSWSSQGGRMAFHKFAGVRGTAASHHHGIVYTLTILRFDQRHLVTTATRHQKLKAKASPRQIVEQKDKPFSELTMGEKVSRAGKDATYTGVIIAGVAVTGLMFYAIGRELLSGNSPSGMYGRALKMCRKNDELSCAIGEPIKGYGEMTRRGRRRHVSHIEFERDGVKHMRMQFYVEGPDGKGTAHMEAKQSDNGKYDFRYLYVDLDNSYRKFIIVDNR